MKTLSVRLVERLREMAAQAERSFEVHVWTGCTFGFKGNIGTGNRGGRQLLSDAKDGFEGWVPSCA